MLLVEKENFESHLEGEFLREKEYFLLYILLVTIAYMYTC